MLDNKATGFVKIYRSLRDKNYYTDSHYTHLWVHLLLSANHTEKIYQGIKIQPGQILTSRDRLSSETGIHHKKIERVLKEFETQQQIVQQKTTKYRLITMVCWEKYQTGVQQSSAQGRLSVPQKDYNNNEENEKNVNNEGKEKIIKKKNEFTKPTIEEIRSFCIERGNSVDPEKFFHHYENVGWVVGRSRSPMKSWRSAIISTWEKETPQKGSSLQRDGEGKIILDENDPLDRKLKAIGGYNETRK